VSNEQDDALKAFEETQASLDTKALENKVNNVSRVMKQINERFPGSVRMPQKKGDGYFVRVVPAGSPQST
jgi:hypothetical protein